MSTAKPLIVMALASESQGLLEHYGIDILYTGVGKLNAAYSLMDHLRHNAHKQPISLILNLGTAGSPTFNTGSIVAADRFAQRDMNATGLGLKPGQTPFDPHPDILEFKRLFSDLPHGLCGSGDSFLQNTCPMGSDIVDMEAYALARICYLESIPFACIKYITDGADNNAHSDWQENLQHAAESFEAILHNGLPETPTAAAKT